MEDKMNMKRLVVFLILLVVCDGGVLDFPPSFKFGSATSSYQVEGAWNVSDKTESMWDTFVHMNPSPIADNSTGDIACDSYHLWERDVEIAAELNLDFYRFSLSWPRILPDGFSNRISEDGIRYYNNLIDGLLAKGIEPVITIYHWDLPQSLQDLGGWTNPLISDWFNDFAEVAFTHFGDRVKTWLTINEPLIVCDTTYNTGGRGLSYVDESILPFICTKNLLMAHAKAYRLYDNEFRQAQHGKVSIANHFLWFEPISEEDAELAELMIEFSLGRYCHPIFGKKGGWPPAIEKIIAENSAAEGFPRSRLPAFTQEEIEFVKGTYDFFGLNHYGARKIRKSLPGETPTYWNILIAHDLPNKILEETDEWEFAVGNLVYYYPKCIRQALNWLKSHYGDIEYMITEAGITTSGGLNDQKRVNHLQGQLTQVLLSIKEDFVNVTGYTYWSLIDNFEWTSGYLEKFGLYSVNFNDPARTRTAKSSAKYYKNITTNRALDKLYL